MTIEEKHKIVYIEGKRYYIYDMTDENPELSDTIPSLFRYQDIEITQGNWACLVTDILRAIDSRNPKDEEELLNLHFPFTTKCIFSKERKMNHLHYKNIYINSNYTISHMMMVIQGLLKFYEIPLNEVYFLIRKTQMKEDNEVSDYIKERTLNCFKKYLKLMSYSDKNIEIIVKNINAINHSVISNWGNTYKDLFLFDDYIYFSYCKKRLIKYLNNRNKLYLSPEMLKTIERSLNYLDNFYKNLEYIRYIIEDEDCNVNDKDQLHHKIDINDPIINILDKEIELLLKSLDSNYITSSKLFEVMMDKYPSSLEPLGLLCNPKGIFFLVHTFLRRKYKSKGFFIYIDNKDNDDDNFVPDNDEIIRRYIYSKDEIDFTDVDKYIDKMGLMVIPDLIEFTDSIKSECILVSDSKVVRKDKIGLDSKVLESIKTVITDYINEHGFVSSEDFKDKLLLPSLKYDWNKYLLLGICRTYFPKLLIEYKSKDYHNLMFELRIK